MSIASRDIFYVADLAELFNCDPETVASRLICGDLPGVKVGRSWIIPRQALFERLNEKAREESATRRMDTTEAGESKTKNNLQRKTLVLMIENKKRPGRKRRIPPPLPDVSTTSK